MTVLFLIYIAISLSLTFLVCYYRQEVVKEPTEDEAFVFDYMDSSPIIFFGTFLIVSPIFFVFCLISAYIFNRQNKG